LLEAESVTAITVLRNAFWNARLTSVSAPPILSADYEQQVRSKPGQGRFSGLPDPLASQGEKV
jgi:hypothetical protein